MIKKLDRSQLIALVENLQNARYATDQELNAALNLLQANVPHPEVSDLIFHPKQEMTSAEIVDTALAYKPIQL